MVTTTLKTMVDAEQVVESQAIMVQGLFLATACIKTMPTKPSIKRSSIIPGVVMVDNSQGLSNLLGLRGRYLCLDGCYWTQEHNP